MVHLVEPSYACATPFSLSSAFMEMSAYGQGDWRKEGITTRRNKCRVHITCQDTRVVIPEDSSEDSGIRIMAPNIDQVSINNLLDPSKFVFQAPSTTVTIEFCDRVCSRQYQTWKGNPLTTCQKQGSALLHQDHLPSVDILQAQVGVSYYE
jgi:hypothetical protein